ncbi:uncharacterized protein YALI1_F25289g [Yarrowia lipolytica]|uniref:Uncharacterized protein n=1 Tax=Yarrowia lipolytica TaxID=4952 RepID=A0A1D8NP38_YARLL|nr:hypothetical protein YALI1_F25289g [Yarrowia lipolytica]
MSSVSAPYSIVARLDGSGGQFQPLSTSAFHQVTSRQVKQAAELCVPWFKPSCNQLQDKKTEPLGAADNVRESPFSTPKSKPLKVAVPESGVFITQCHNHIQLQVLSTCTVVI